MTDVLLGMTSNSEPLLTIEDVAEYLQVSVKTLRKWRENGDGPTARKMGRHLRYQRDELDEWVRSC